MTPQDIQLQKLISHPEDVISRYNLIYTHEEDLLINRKNRGKGFSYHMGGKLIKNTNEINRIKGLVIPPMWKDVRISHFENSHLQAIGFDNKHRKQYLYHKNWEHIRNATKFYKMHAFGKKLPKIRQQLDLDIAKQGWPKEKVIALVIRLMEETHIRIGNSHYEKQNKSYGLTTLRKRHINIHKNTLKIEFTGKKGVEHSISLKNKKLIKLVNKCEELPGWTLFKFIDEEGTRKTIQSSHVNEYLHALCGNNFTAKDFRTWSASVSFFNALFQLGTPCNENETKSNIVKAYDVAASTLGNTRSVCKKYYVHPILVESYETGCLSKPFSRLEKSAKTDAYLSPSEKEMLQLFKTYSPTFLDKN